LAGVLAAVVLAAGTARAEGAGISLSAAYAEKYVWRGIPVNEDAVVQPSVTLSQGAFALNVWGNIDTTDWGKTDGGYGDETGGLTEIDYTASWGMSSDLGSLGGGFITYTFPSTPFPSTTEAFVSLTLAAPLSPKISYFLDVDTPFTGPASYLAFDLSHSFPMGGKTSLDFALHIAHSSENYNLTYYGPAAGHDAWNDWSASVALPISLGAGFSITPAYLYTSLIDPDIRDAVESWSREEDTGLYMVSLGWAGEL
jgi:hypothetical protein